MNKVDVAKLLTFISAFDNRTVGPETVEAWHMVLARVTLEDALAAVKDHFSGSTEYLMPAHVVAGVKRLKTKLAPSDASLYCQKHHWPANACPRCEDAS